MNLVDPIKRFQVAAVAFIVLGLGIAVSAEPLPTLDADLSLAPLAEVVDAPANHARRAWREQVPAVIVVRRVRPS
jgi:hypothetical protein